MKFIFALSFAVFLASGSPLISDELEGEWERIQMWEKGKLLPEEGAGRMVLKFSDGAFDFQMDGKTVVNGTFRVVDEKSDPRKLDMIHAGGEEEVAIPAVFRIADGILHLCHDYSPGDGRPEKMVKSDKTVYVTFRRKSD